MSVHINQQVKVPQSSAGSRLDQVAAELFPDFSRSRLQSWIKRGELNVDGLAKKPNSKLGGGETLDLRAELESSEEWLPEALEFEVVHEDASVIVVNKPRSMVVHPATYWAIAQGDHPLIGDAVYGKPSSDPECSSLSRQALHAKKLGFVHPVSGKPVAWETQLPDDIADLYDTLVAR